VEKLQTGTGVYVSWRLPSTLSAVHGVWARAAVELEIRIKPEPMFGIELVTRELMVNAIRHGNLNDSRKQVRLDVHIRSGCLLIRVTDEGSGFNWRNEFTQTGSNAADEQKPSGRGLQIARLFATKITYNRAGNTAKAWFDITQQGVNS